MARFFRKLGGEARLRATNGTGEHQTISPLITSLTLLASCFRLKGLGRKWILLSLSRPCRKASSV